ncbi:hypothetical protein KR222_003456, partial [Zaprionus bogoriensis]
KMSAENIGLAAGLDKYAEEDFFSFLVRYGLFVGAIFQFICITAAVMLSGNESSSLEASEDEARGLIDEPVPAGGGAGATAAANANAARRLHKIRKLEKKKRR